MLMSFVVRKYVSLLTAIARGQLPQVCHCKD